MDNTFNLNKFWINNPDRVYSKDVVYPFVGKYLENVENPKVLDIGCQIYNKYNKHLSKNHKINYSTLDIEEEIKDVIKDNHIKCSILEIDKKFPELKEKFDVIISFGVLGFYYFDEKDTKKYLKNISFLLKNDGLFILKLDYIQRNVKRAFFKQFLKKLIKVMADILLYTKRNNKIKPTTSSGRFRYWLRNDISNLVNLYFKKTDFKENKSIPVDQNNYYEFSFYKKISQACRRPVKGV